MSPKKDLASVLGDAEWLPAHWDQPVGAIQFARVPRETHSRLTFLSDQYLREIEPPVVQAAVADLSSADPATAPHYIFHSAFCCSTLLTRALDVPGIVMGLNEPQIVNELAAAALQRRLGGDVLKTVTRLLGRPFGPGEGVVVKPGNEANLVAPALLESDERSRAIFLYAPLPRFLASVANKGMWGRIWGRRLYSLLGRTSGIQLGFSDAERFELTDLQVSALAWLLHQAEGAGLVARFPDRVRTLDSETFLAKPSDTLIALARHFGLDADAKRWTEVAHGRVFKSHSKEIGRSFDTDARSEKAPAPTIEEEIEMVANWAQAVAGHAGLSVEMPTGSRLLPAAA
jgi:hypothetical protein